jgi:phospholipid/cholesterol/gamma-HCH transport system permease protein
MVVVLATGMGVGGGWLTSLYLLDMSTPEFMKGLRLFFVPFDIQFGIIKSLSFGLTITSIGAFFGFTTRGGAEGVGIATTRAVVVSSMVILVLDAFWAAILL